MRKTLPDCHLRKDGFREFQACPEPASYSALIVLTNGEELKLDFCSEHLRNAVRIAEIEAARTFPDEPPKVALMSFHNLALADRRQRAS